MTVYLTSDLVGVFWLRSLVAFPGDCDFANLVSDPWVEITESDGTSRWVPNWPGKTFVSIMTVGGSSDIMSPEYVPTYQIDCWSRPENQGSNPPWNVANQLAEVIRWEQYQMSTSKILTLPGAYPAVRIVDVTVVSEPVRVSGDPLGLARYTLDVSLTFVPED